MCACRLRKASRGSQRGRRRRSPTHRCRTFAGPAPAASRSRRIRARTRRGSRSTPRSSRRITASKASRANGSTRDAAIAPNITALTTVPAARRLEAHVERVEFAAVRAHDGGEPVRVEPSVGERHLLRRGERAAERGDHHGALGTHHSGLHDARGFEELRGDREIDAARNRQQRQDRPSSAEHARRLRPDLDVIRRRAGALGDAGDRRALRRMSRGVGEVDQPFGEHAAAFSAERRDQDCDGLHRDVYAGCIIAMIAPRRRAATRSRQPGLLMTSPR